MFGAAAKKTFMNNKLICVGTTCAAYFMYNNDINKLVSNNRIYAAAEKNIAKCYSFGNNLFGQLGLGNDIKQIKPIFVENLPQNLTFIDANFDQSAFVTGSGKLFTSGCGAHDRLGHGRSDTNQALPQMVENLSDVASVSIGGFHMM